MTEQPSQDDLNTVDIEDLEAVDTPEGEDHPDEVTEEEAEEGHAVYLEVDDTDDESNGVDL